MRLYNYLAAGVEMVIMNKGHRWEALPTWVIIDFPFSHRKLILRSCISHTIFKMGMTICSPTILDKAYLIANSI